MWRFAICFWKNGGHLITELYNFRTKEGKKLHFPDFLVYSEEYLEPNKASMMELFCENR